MCEDDFTPTSAPYGEPSYWVRAFEVDGHTPAEVMAAVIEAHRVLDGYFRRPVVAVEADGSSWTGEAGWADGEAVHLVVHGTGAGWRQVIDRAAVISVATVEQREKTVVTMRTARVAGADPAVLSQVEDVTRDLLGDPPCQAECPPPPAPAPRAQPPLFVGRFRTLADQHPDRVAIVHGDRRMTYAELAALSDRMSRGLVGRGLGKGSRLLVLAAREPRLAALLIAAFAIGATVSILDPQHGESYIRSCTLTFSPDLIVDMAGLGAPLPAKVTSAVELEQAGPDGGAARLRHDVLDGDDCAIVTFTSGTTGTQKAVAGRYGSLTEFFDWMDATLGPLAGRAFGMCSSLGHDPLQRDLMTPLYLGGRIVIPDGRDLAGPEAMCDWLRSAAVEVICVNPVLATAIAESGQGLPALRTLFFVGSALSRDHAMRIRRAVPHARVINLYGSTETQRAVSFFEIPASADEVASLPEIVPLGVGMKDVEVLVATGEERAPCRPFRIGEILVRSGHIALGYLGDAELTARKFLPGHGARNGTGEGPPAYATGDLGYLSPRYGVVFVGRVDDQYKINGYRVELEQVTAACREHPLVKDAATVVVTIEGLATLVTWVVPADPEMVVEPVEFRSFLARRLPRYMVPTQIKMLPELPLTANNKIDAARLRSLATAETSAGVPPAVDAVQLDTVRTFVGRHTGLREIPTDVPLDALGIDSLRIHALVSRLGPASSADRQISPAMTIEELLAARPAHQFRSPVESVESRGSSLRPRDLLGPVTAVTETTISFGDAQYDHLCSNSYLGLNAHQGLRGKAEAFIRENPSLGSHGSMELNGFTVWHERLADELKGLYGAAAAVLYGSCYLANISVIPALAGPGDDIFIDESCHKSIVDGCLLSGARLHVYKHNDADDLEAALGQLTGTNRLIVTEGVFGIEGDILDLPAFAELATRNGCLLVVDEACALGQIGATGRGVEEHFGMPGAIDVTVGTLSKALCTAGGYAVCDRATAARLRFQRGETFSTAISPLQVFIAAEAAHILRQEGRALMPALTRNAEIWRRRLHADGFDIGTSATGIVPIRCDDERELDAAYRGALAAGIYCLPLARPWTAGGYALRTSVTAAHAPQRLEDAAARLGRYAKPAPAPE